MLAMTRSQRVRFEEKEAKAEKRRLREAEARRNEQFQDPRWMGCAICIGVTAQNPWAREVHMEATCDQ